MSAHVARAQLLLQQSRPADAERELLLALSQDPLTPLPHALLALARSDQNRAAEALDEAKQAVGLAPDESYFHYVLACVLHRLDRHREALDAIREALRLDPDSEDAFALQASIHLGLRDWSAALEAANQGLALNPEHVNSANLRSMALVRLGRKVEAAETVDFALERAPENAFSHANQGWNRLHQNDPKAAQHHFREALRLEPDLEYARQGMLESIKARNPLYRGMLAYFLWIGRQSGKLQWAFIIGSYVGVRFLVQLTQTYPLLWVIVAVFYLFIYLSWTAVPMFNLLLRLHPFGRYVLSRDERRGGYWFGAALGAAAIALAASFFDPSGIAFVLFLVLLVLSVCVAGTVMRTGRARFILAAATAALAAVGLGATYLASLDRGADLSLFRWFIYGFLGFQLLANVVSRK